MNDLHASQQNFQLMRDFIHEALTSGALDEEFYSHPKYKGIFEPLMTEECNEEINGVVEDDNLFDESDTDILECLLLLIDEYMRNNVLDMQNPNFAGELYEELQYVVSEVIFENCSLDLENETESINDLVVFSLETYFIYFPPRSSGNTFTTYINHEIIDKKIKSIREKYQPVQRTDEWYSFRHNLITASSAHKIFDGQCSTNNIIFEKCKPITKSESAFVNVDSPLHWGQKYEPVSVMIYENLYNTTVEDFGCICHDQHKFLGASPDGIITDKTSSRYGRMLEIKNIVNREINGIPKKEYWIQMQLQMEVCDLNECDFLETKFVEYQNEDEFYEEEHGSKMKGVMIYFHDILKNKPFYVYKTMDIDEKEDIENWKQTVIAENVSDNIIWIRNICWKLEEMSCVLVLRNNDWFEMAVPYIKSTWDIIASERITGYSHREANKRHKDCIENKNVCLINIKNKEKL